MQKKYINLLKYILYQKHSCHACYSLFKVGSYSTDLETKILQSVPLL